MTYDDCISFINFCGFKRTWAAYCKHAKCNCTDDSPIETAFLPLDVVVFFPKTSQSVSRVNFWNGFLFTINYNVWLAGSRSCESGSAALLQVHSYSLGCNQPPSTFRPSSHVIAAKTTWWFRWLACSSTPRWSFVLIFFCPFLSLIVCYVHCAPTPSKLLPPSLAQW